MIEPIDMTQFVPKYFEMDPKTDDLIRNGNFLEDGMMVLLEAPDYRVEVGPLLADAVKTASNPSMIAQALRWNRWVTVSNLGWGGDDVCSFVGIYHDGTKKLIEAPCSFAWYVKKKSLPKPVDEDAEQKDLQERGRPISNAGKAMVESMKQYGRNPAGVTRFDQLEP